jgi:hypothetical protein
MPPIIAVLGQFRSGTSVTAGVLHELGVCMGNSLYEIPEHRYFEARQLVDICRRCFSEPDLAPLIERDARVALLRDWAQMRRRTDANRVFGGKHPLLCLLVPELVEAWGDVLFVRTERPVEESVASAHRHFGWPVEITQRSFAAMLEKRNADLEPHAAKTLTIGFYDLLSQPEAEIERLICFTSISPTPEQRAAALNLVQVRQA